MVVSELKRAYSEMHGAERKVTDYILEHTRDVTTMSMAELSAATGTSDATIMRVCRRIDQTGFTQLKINLAMEMAADTSLESPGTERVTDVVSFIDHVATGISKLSKSISMAQVETCVEILLKARTVFAFGWGNTNTAAEDLSHRLLRCGINTFSSDNVEYIFRNIALADSSDAFVAYTRSGSSVNIIECCKLAQANDVPVILVTGDRESKAARHANVILEVRGQDDIMEDWGDASHAYELVINDLLLYFLKQRAPRYQMGIKTEAILAQFKL